MKNKVLYVCLIILLGLVFVYKPAMIKADSGFDSSWDSESSSYDSGGWDIDFDSSDESSSFADKLEIILYVVPIFITTCSIYYALTYYIAKSKLFNFLAIAFSGIITLVEMYLVYKGEYLIVSIVCLLLILMACICYEYSKKINEKKKGVKNEK